MFYNLLLWLIALEKHLMKRIHEYMQIKEAAEFLGVTATTLRNWERSGKLLPHRHPINQYRLYKREDLEEFLKKLYTQRR